MDVVVLLVFISLVLVGGGLLFFVYRLREGDFEHGDRLALTPLAEDEAPAAVSEAELSEPSHDGTSEALLGSRALEGGTPHVKS